MNKRTLSLVAAGIAIVIAAGFFGLKMTYESKVRNAVENFLATLPEPLEATAGRIDVSFLDKSVVISDLAGKYTGKKLVTFSIAKLSASGINADAFKEGAGTAHIADSLKIENVVYDSDFFTLKIDQYAYQNISGDLQRILNENIRAIPVFITMYADPAYFTSGREQKELFGHIAPLLEALETLSIGGVAMRGYSFSTPGDGTVTVAEGVSGKYSLREIENMAFTNIAFTPAGSSAPVTLLGTVGIDGAALPSFAEPLKAISQGAAPSAVFQTMLRGQKLALRNLHMKDMTIRDPENPGHALLTLAGFSFSYAADSSLDMDLGFDGLKIVRELLKNDIPEEALALMPDPLSNSGAVKITATEQDGKLDTLECKKIAFKEDTLGNFSQSFAIRDLNTMAFLMGVPGPAALTSFDLTVTDTGASDVLYTALAAFNENDTPERLRMETIRELPAPESLPNDTLRELVAALRTFLEKPGGTFRMTLAPASPLALWELQATALTEPEKLGLTVSISPAQ